MQITQTIRKVLETASAKALATMCTENINVVPVSMIRVNDTNIWLFDFFMDKTANNICAHSACALTAWEGMKGIQIKGDVTYVKDGDIFDESVEWVKTQNPNRVVKGLLIIEPKTVFDVSPGGAYEPEDLGNE